MTPVRTVVLGAQAPPNVVGPPLELDVELDVELVDVLLLEVELLDDVAMPPVPPDDDVLAMPPVPPDDDVLAPPPVPPEELVVVIPPMPPAPPEELVSVTPLDDEPAVPPVPPAPEPPVPVWGRVPVLAVAPVPLELHAEATTKGERSRATTPS